MSKKMNLIIPKDIPDLLRKIFFTIQNAYNNLSNVTYSQLSLSANDIPLSKINLDEWHIPLALPAADATTTSTSYVRCSGIFTWDPAKFPTTGGSWYFEASLAISDAAQTVTAHLIGSAEVTGSAITRTGATSLAAVRSSALTMPTAASLFCEYKTSNAAATASFGGARLIFVPT